MRMGVQRKGYREGEGTVGRRETGEGRVGLGLKRRWGRGGDWSWKE